MAVSDAAIIGTAGFVAVAAMYLYFCWKVYNRSGDIHALEVAVKVGRFLGLRRFDAPPREAATEHIELPPAPVELPRQTGEAIVGFPDEKDDSPAFEAAPPP